MESELKRLVKFQNSHNFLVLGDAVEVAFVLKCHQVALEGTKTEAAAPDVTDTGESPRNSKLFASFD